MINICILGASTIWSPRLATDLISTFDEPIEFRLIDINPAPAELCAQWGQVANKHHGRKDKYIPYTDRRAALKGADAVLITLAVGGLEVMAKDLLIPEKYGIYTTVGDTTGPAGWSRALRNIPLYQAFAKDFQEVCPKAIIVNYSNPMAALTATLEKSCDNPIVGLCHSYFETKDVLQKIHGLEDWSKLSISIAGMNHFTWIVDYKVDRQDGYKLLREKLAGRSLIELLPEESADDIGILSGHSLAVEMFDATGYLPYPADRHISEFVSDVLCGRKGHPERHETKDKDGNVMDTIRYCDVKRTSMETRHVWMKERSQSIHDWISGKNEMPKQSRETGTEVIAAYLYNKPFIDSFNTLNVGQIPGLPLDACVETLGCIDGLGVRPFMIDNVPEHLLEIMRPQAICQKWTTQGVMDRDKDKLLQALYRDPQCAHMHLGEIRQMAEELFEANEKWFSC